MIVGFCKYFVFVSFVFIILSVKINSFYSNYMFSRIFYIFYDLVNIFLFLYIKLDMYFYFCVFIMFNLLFVLFFRDDYICIWLVFDSDVLLR